MSADIDFPEMSTDVFENAILNEGGDVWQWGLENKFGQHLKHRLLLITVLCYLMLLLHVLIAAIIE